MDKIAEKKAKDRIKRQDARMAKMTDGFLELERWLCDLVRKGVIAYPDYPRQFWENAAARMVDAQASGAAGMLRRLRDIRYSDDHQWQEEALYWTTQLWSLTKGFIQMTKHSMGIQQQLLAVAGWGATPKEVQSDASAMRVLDLWVVVGRQVEKVEDITVQRNWLYGTESGKFALVLYFAFRNTPIESNLFPGKMYRATLAFFPESDRAIPENLEECSSPIVSVQVFPDWTAAEVHLSDTRIDFPWIDFVPMWVGDLTVARMEEGWCLVDRERKVVRLTDPSTTKTLLSLLGASQGIPVPVFLVATTKGFVPMSVWVEGSIAVL